MQYELFSDDSEYSILKQEIKDIKEKGNNVRRGVFARCDEIKRGQSELMKLYLKQQAELEELKALLRKEKNDECVYSFKLTR